MVMPSFFYLITIENYDFVQKSLTFNMQYAIMTSRWFWAVNRQNRQNVLQKKEVPQMTVVKEKMERSFVPTLTCDVDINTLFEASWTEEGDLRIVFGNPNVTKNQLVTLVEKRKEVVSDPEVIEWIKWLDDDDSRKSQDAKFALCDKLSAHNARVNFNQGEQTLTLFSTNGHSPKGSLFAGIVHSPFTIKNKEGCLMNRGLPIGRGKSVLVLLVKEPVPVEHKNGKFRVEPPKPPK